MSGGITGVWYTFCSHQLEFVSSIHVIFFFFFYTLILR